MKYIAFLFTIITLKAFSFQPITFIHKPVPTPDDSVEVVFGVTNPDAVSTIRTSIKNMNGVKLLAYCDNHSVFFVYIDESIHSSPSAFINILKNSFPNYSESILLKEGTIAGLLNFCDFSDPEDSKHVKLNYHH